MYTYEWCPISYIRFSYRTDLVICRCNVFKRSKRYKLKQLLNFKISVIAFLGNYIHNDFNSLTTT